MYCKEFIVRTGLVVNVQRLNDNVEEYCGSLDVALSTSISNNEIHSVSHTVNIVWRCCFLLF